MTWEELALPLMIFAAALLYSSVGHGGASGYLMAMALAGVAPDVMKPTALVLNVLVAGIGSVRFVRAGHFDFQIFWPFALLAIPLAFVGGAIKLPDFVYRKLLGAVLLWAAARLFWNQRGAAQGDSTERAARPALALAIPLGAGIGLLSGLTGVGGGIFLSPILLLMNWADARRTAAVSVVFILVNSIAGLAGQYSAVAQLPTVAIPWALAAVVGGLIGSGFGARRLATLTLRRLLALVLVIAAAKLLVT